MISRTEVLDLIGKALAKTYKVLDRKTSQVVHVYTSEFPRPDVYWGPTYLHLEMTAAEKITWLQQNGGFMALSEEQLKLKEIKEKLQAGADVKEAMIETLDTLDGAEEGVEPVVEAPVEEPVAPQPEEQPAVEPTPEPVIEEPAPVVEEPKEEVIPEPEVQPEPVIEAPIEEKPAEEVVVEPQPEVIPEPVIEQPKMEALDKQVLVKGTDADIHFVDSRSWICALVDGKLVCEVA